MGAREIEQFLSYLANERRVSASTQNQALSALLFLYREVLGVSLPWVGEFVRSKVPRHLPVVLTVEEVKQLMEQARLKPHPYGLVLQLLYGTGMRLMEVVRLRVKDLELSRREIVVRDGKGGKDRVTLLPESLLEPMQRQIGERSKSRLFYSWIPVYYSAASRMAVRACGLSCGVRLWCGWLLFVDVAQLWVLRLRPLCSLRSARTWAGSWLLGVGAGGQRAVRFHTCLTCNATMWGWLTNRILRGRSWCFGRLR